MLGLIFVACMVRAILKMELKATLINLSLILASDFILSVSWRSRSPYHYDSAYWESFVFSVHNPYIPF